MPSWLREGAPLGTDRTAELPSARHVPSATLADAVACAVREAHARGRDTWTVDCGDIDVLYAAWDVWVGWHGEPPAPLVRRPGWRRERVLRSLRSTARSRELFEPHEALSLYPGVVDGWCYVWELRPEWRSPPPAPPPA